MTKGIRVYRAPRGTKEKWVRKEKLVCVGHVEILECQGYQAGTGLMESRESLVIREI